MVQSPRTRMIAGVETRTRGSHRLFSKRDAPRMLLSRKLAAPRLGQDVHSQCRWAHDHERRRAAGEVGLMHVRLAQSQVELMIMRGGSMQEFGRGGEQRGKGGERRISHRIILSNSSLIFYQAAKRGASFGTTRSS